MTATLPTGNGVPPDWFNVMDYGAVGNSNLSPGVGTDDTAAFQAAINAAKAANGTVYVPGPHYYRITDTLLCNLHSWRFTGSGSGGSGPALYFDTTANKPLLNYASTYLFELDHLTLVGRAGYTGNLVDVDGNGTGGTGGDCQQYHIHHLNLRADASTTNSLLRLNKTVIATIDNCRFADSKVHLLDGGTNYINAVTIRDCVFNPSCTDAHIKLTSGDVEMLHIEDCTFEAGTNTTALKCATNTRLYKMLMSGCWFGDSSPGVIWVDGITNQSNAHISTIRDCMFFLGGGVNDIAIKFGDASGVTNNCGPFLVQGCSFLGSGNAYGHYMPDPTFGNVHEIGNSYVSLTNIWKTGMTSMTRLRQGCVPNPDLVAGQFGWSHASTTAGFYGATPIGQAARAGQLTDSTGGTVSGTLAAGITDAVAKNAIASLAAKVNALETIVHNLGLSA
jgi:hypothetical protein